MEEQLLKLRDNIQEKMDIFTEILTIDHDCRSEGCLFCETYHKYLHATRIELEVVTKMLQSICDHDTQNAGDSDHDFYFCTKCGETENLTDKYTIEDMRN